MSLNDKMEEHNEQTRLISLKPELIGIHGIILGTGEANLFRKNGSLYHQPDNLLFDPTTQTLYNIEYKLHNQESKAKTQLRECSRMLTGIFPSYDIINLYVSEDFKVKRI